MVHSGCGNSRAATCHGQSHSHARRAQPVKTKDSEVNICAGESELETLPIFMTTHEGGEVQKKICCDKRYHADRVKERAICAK